MTDSLPDSEVRLCAQLGAEWKEAVEDLLFFHPRQAQLEEEILATIHAFGLPRVLVRGELLSVEVGAERAVGALFALVGRGREEELAGLLLFLRQEHRLLCLHLSVLEEYTFHGPRASLRVAARLIDGLRRIGTQLAGVRQVDIYYKRDGWHPLPLTLQVL